MWDSAHARTTHTYPIQSTFSGLSHQQSCLSKSEAKFLPTSMFRLSKSQFSLEWNSLVFRFSISSLTSNITQIHQFQPSLTLVLSYGLCQHLEPSSLLFKVMKRTRKKRKPNKSILDLPLGPCNVFQVNHIDIHGSNDECVLWMTTYLLSSSQPVELIMSSHKWIHFWCPYFSCYSFINI